MTYILYAEDDDSLRRALTGIFSNRFGFNVDAVSTGEDLLRMYQPIRHNLVITDNDMGFGISGLDAVRTIRKISTRVPIIVMSAGNVQREAELAGAYFVAKGIQSFGELEVIIRKIKL